MEFFELLDFHGVEAGLRLGHVAFHETCIILAVALQITRL